MPHAKTIKIGALIISLGILVTLFSACSTGVSKEDYAALQKQLADKEQQVAQASAALQKQTAEASAASATLQKQVTDKENELTTLKQQLDTATAQGKDITALKDQITAKEKELATIKANMMLFVIPNAPPRQPAPPPPPGTPPPARPVQLPPKTTLLAFYVDTVTAGPGESRYNVDASRYCAITSTFKRGMHVVWRMTVTRGTLFGSMELQPNDVQSAVVKLANGETRSFSYGRHGANVDSPWFWTAAWDIPPDYPLGLLDFTVEVTTSDGKVGTFKQIPVSSPPAIESRLTIVQ